MSRCRQQLVHEQRKKTYKYSLYQSLNGYTLEAARGPLSAANPPLPRRKSAAFCTVISTEIRRFPGSFPHFLHMVFISKTAKHFPQRFRSDSGGISGLDREEKWRKAGGGGELRKSRSFGADVRPSSVDDRPMLKRRCISAARW